MQAGSFDWKKETAQAATTDKPATEKKSVEAASFDWKKVIAKDRSAGTSTFEGWDAAAASN